MGWTVYDSDHSPKTREDERAEIVRLYTSLVDTAPCTAECLMASKVRSVWYLAIRLAPKPGHDVADVARRGYVPDASGAIVYAGIVLTSRNDGEWGYKDLCESMGPHDAEAPLKLLELLSPLDPEADTYAGAWRDRVRAAHAARRARLKVRAGDVIEFDEPIAFTGGLTARQFQAFEYRRSALSRAQILYRTLGTQHHHTVRMSAKAVQQRGGRLVAADDAASTGTDV
jgi:hypothetical protein